MIAKLLEPKTFAQVVAVLFIAVLFLQSGIDKVIGFGGNLEWLKSHFAKSFLSGQVKFMLVVVMIAEVIAGALALVGAAQLAVLGTSALAMWAAQLAALDILMLFFGQRVAKDYAGAAALVPYFILCVGTVLLLA